MAARLESITGFEEFTKALQDFPDRVAKNVMRTAIRKGAEVLHATAKNLAPELEQEDRHKHDPAEPGRLKNSVYHKLISELSNDMQQTYFVGVRRGAKNNRVKVKGGAVVNLDAYYWTWVEFGHWYVPPRTTEQKRMYSKRKFNERSRGTGTAVWVPARHFMRDAWSLSRDAVYDTVIRYMEERIPREAQRLGLQWKAP